MIAANYKTLKDLKKSIGQPLLYTETSMFGLEFKPNGSFAVVGPSPHQRDWYAKIVMVDGKIKSVD